MAYVAIMLRLFISSQVQEEDEDDDVPRKDEL